MHSCSAASLRHITAHQWLRVSVCIALSVLLMACGFRLKGVAPLPFSTIYTNIAENSAFGANIRRAITASSPHTRFVSTPQDAEARLIQLSNQQTRRELVIDAEGQVEEYELNLQFTFQLSDANGRIVLPTTVLRASREVPYDPDDAQAKQSEMRMIFEDMQQSLVARVVRHLSAPDVIEAFQQAQTLPPLDGTPDTLDETETSEFPSQQAGDPVSDWDTPPTRPSPPFN